MYILYRKQECVEIHYHACQPCPEPLMIKTSPPYPSKTSC